MCLHCKYTGNIFLQWSDINHNQIENEVCLLKLNSYVHQLEKMSVGKMASLLKVVLCMFCKWIFKR